MAGRAESDEHYILDLCDEVLGIPGRSPGAVRPGFAEIRLPCGPAGRRYPWMGIGLASD